MPPRFWKRPATPPDSIEHRPAGIGLGKKVCFSLLVTVGFFLALEGGLALLGVRPAASDEDPYVGFASYLPLFEEQKGDDGHVYLATRPAKLDLFNPQRFLKDKPPGTYRIFCLGGSTTYGHPYEDATSFAGWLRELLPEADPTRRYEVINAGGISYASYRVTMLMEELVRYEPDLFIVYSGHNEFLERRTYEQILRVPAILRNLAACLNQTRTYSLLQRTLGPSPEMPTAAENHNLLPAEVDAILDRTIGPENYTREDAARPTVLMHYRFSLERMIEMANSAGARIVFVVPASNLKNSSPFKSEHRADLDGAERTQWQALYRRATEANAAGRHQDALAALNEAASLDDRRADLHYLRARVLLALRRTAEAKAAFQRAREEDVCPLRALAAMEAAVREVASQRRVPLVDFAALVEKESADGIPGEDLFLDHVHPTIRGNRLLALTLLDTLCAHGIVHRSPLWNDAAIQRVTDRVEGRLDRAAHANALRNLAKVLAWAGKFDESQKLALRVVEDLPDDAHAQCLAGDSLLGENRLDEAMAHYQRSLQLRPDYVKALYGQGVALARQRKLDAAETSLQRAVTLDPQHADAFAALGHLRFDQGRLPEACAAFQRALAIHPRAAGVHRELGLALAQLGQLDAATGQMREAVAITPHDAGFHNDLALLLLDQGDLNGADAASSEALRLDPGHARAYLTRGLLRQRQGRLEEAAAAFRQLVQADPADADAHFNLGNILLQQGKTDQATREYQETLRLAPDYPEAEANLRQLDK